MINGSLKGFFPLGFDYEMVSINASYLFFLSNFFLWNALNNFIAIVWLSKASYILP